MKDIASSTSEEEKSKVSVGTAALLEYLQEYEQCFRNNKSNLQNEYTFCLGADAFMDLTAGKWKESQRVMELLEGRFLVLNRIEDDAKTQQNCIPVQLQERINSVHGARLVSVPSLGAVSSSRVREAIKSQDWPSLDEKMVHPRVLEYIRKHGLYTE